MRGQKFKITTKMSRQWIVKFPRIKVSNFASCLKCVEFSTFENKDVREHLSMKLSVTLLMIKGLCNCKQNTLTGSV